MRGLVQECKNAQLLTIKKLGNADYGLADSNNIIYRVWKDVIPFKLQLRFEITEMSMIAIRSPFLKGP